jgi:lipocalin
VFSRNWFDRSKTPKNYFGMGNCVFWQHRNVEQVSDHLRLSKDKIALAKYAGDWFLIGHTDNWFDRNMHDMKASYALADGGTRLLVHNTGKRMHGSQTREKSFRAVATRLSNSSRVLKL